MPTPRKPTAILKLEGDYYPSRHGDRSGEPQPGGEPRMPAWMPERAKEFWNRNVPELIRTGVATSVDEESLVRMCIWYDEGQKLLDLREDERDPKWIYRFQAADKNLRDYMAKFGMTPVDRTRINVTRQADHDPAAEFIA